jgi:outer membrane lipoprotein-sorting protein
MSARKGIKLTLFLLLVAGLFICQAVVVSADEQLSSVMDGILKRYGALKGLSVPYKREVMTKSMAMLGTGAKAETATGKILFKPPHYLAIQQATPGIETITTDGQTVWYYKAAKNTVEEYPVDDDLGKVIRLLSEIFSGLSKVGDSFVVTQSDQGDKKDYNLKLVPNPSWEGVDHIVLLVDRDDFSIRVVEIHDLGGITRFMLDKLSVRKDLKKEDFSFKVPKGAKTIKE